MSSKTKKTAAVASPAVVAIEIKSEDTGRVSLLSEKDYLLRVTRSGNPGKVRDKETRVYEGEKGGSVSGTELFILGVFSTFDTPNRKEYSVSEYLSGRDNLRKENYKNPSWERLERLYKAAPIRSKNLPSKFGALSDLGKDGVYRAFNVEKIGTPEYRRLFGFSF